MPHRGVRLRAALLRVTTRAAFPARKTFTRNFLPWTKMGEVRYLVLPRLPARKAGKKKQAYNAKPEGKRASYTTRKYYSLMSSPGRKTFQIRSIISQ